jgi:hypothetical protein
MKAMEIRRYGQHDARRRLDSRPSFRISISKRGQKFGWEQSCLSKRTQGLEALAGAGGIEPPNGGIKVSLIIQQFQGVFGRNSQNALQQSQ